MKNLIRKTRALLFLCILFMVWEAFLFWKYLDQEQYWMAAIFAGLLIMISTSFGKGMVQLQRFKKQRDGK
jgi:hypothetical protein